MQHSSPKISLPRFSEDCPEASEVSFQSASPEQAGVPFSRPEGEFFIPDDEQCMALWEQYGVFDNIGRHSLRVAEIATAIGMLGQEAGCIGPEYVRSIRASALLHDLAKGHCLKNGGHHAQLGAAWVVAETGNPVIAQGVLHHVWWPFPIRPLEDFLSLVVLYSDNRVQHDTTVSLEKRLDDLLGRYATTRESRRRIEASMRQAWFIEWKLSELLEVELHACTFDSGGLVSRA